MPPSDLQASVKPAGYYILTRREGNCNRKLPSRLRERAVDVAGSGDIVDAAVIEPGQADDHTYRGAPAVRFIIAISIDRNVEFTCDGSFGEAVTFTELTDSFVVLHSLSLNMESLFCEKSEHRARQGCLSVRRGAGYAQDSRASLESYMFLNRGS